MRRILLALALAANVFGTNSNTVNAFVIHPQVYCTCSWKKQDIDSPQLPHKAVKQPNNEVSGRPKSPFQKQQRNTTRTKYEKEERASYLLDDIRDGIRSVLEEMKSGDTDFSAIDDSTSHDSGGGMSENIGNDWSNIGRGKFVKTSSDATSSSTTHHHRSDDDTVKNVESGATTSGHGGGWDFGSIFGGSGAGKSHESSSTTSNHGGFSFGSIFGDNDATGSSTSSGASSHGGFSFGGSDSGGSSSGTSFSSHSSSFGGLGSGSHSFGSGSFSSGSHDSGSHDFGGHDSHD
jgi:hypothetical protein